MTEGTRRLRVLSIDGGGMRGLYTSVYLSALAKQAAARRNTSELDVGKAFDLIVGTSTGVFFNLFSPAIASPARATLAVASL